MPGLVDLLSRIVPSARHLSVLFGVLLLFHILAALTCLVTGAVAARSPKRPGRHPGFGTVYLWALAIVFVSATGMSVLHWPDDTSLLVLGTTSFALASLGLSARKIRWRGWRTAHILGMSLSYVVLLTAFYVDNGPHLPVWDRLPAIAYWTLPSLAGLPLLVRAVRRHTRITDDLRATAGALGRMATGFSAFLSTL